MADASRILQTTLIPTISQNPYHCRTNNLSHYDCSVKRFHQIRCSSLYTIATNSESAVGPTAVTWGCDIDSVQNASALQQWLSDCGLPPQKMAIRKVQIGERGLVAMKNIRMELSRGR